MNAPIAGQGDILRGMQVEPRPLRLARRDAQPVAHAVAQPAVPAVSDGAAMRERLEQAERQAREEGARAGYEDGLRRGLAEAESHARSALEQAQAQALAPLAEQRQRLASLLAALEHAAADGLLVAEEDAVALCYEVLCRILGAAAPQPQALRAQWQALCAQSAASRGAVLHVHPQDAALLASRAGNGDGPDEGAARVRWVADPEVALGGCIVRSIAGGLDARLETLLLACKSALLATRAARDGAAA